MAKVETEAVIRKPAGYNYAILTVLRGNGLLRNSRG